jgi:hypothetical protein
MLFRIAQFCSSQKNPTSGAGDFGINAERSLLRCLPHQHCTIACVRAISAVSVMMKA